MNVSVLYRCILLIVFCIIALRYHRATIRPNLAHDEFDLGRRQYRAATTLADNGARLCCETDCQQLKRALGTFAGMLHCTTRTRNPLCGQGDGILVRDVFYPGGDSIRDVELLVVGISNQDGDER